MTKEGSFLRRPPDGSIPALRLSNRPHSLSLPSPCRSLAQLAQYDCCYPAASCRALVLQLTGVITSVVKWDDVLARLFPTQVSGVDAVLETGTRTYTYRVEAGRATLRYAPNGRGGTSWKDGTESTCALFSCHLILQNPSCSKLPRFLLP